MGLNAIIDEKMTKSLDHEIQVRIIKRYLAVFESLLGKMVMPGLMIVDHSFKC